MTDPSLHAEDEGESRMPEAEAEAPPDVSPDHIVNDGESQKGDNTDTGGDVDTDAEGPNQGNVGHAAQKEDADGSGGDKSNGRGANKQTQSGDISLVLSVAVPIALQIGWSTAVLFGHLPDNSGKCVDRIPTEHELPRAQRIATESNRLKCLLAQLESALPSGSPSLPAIPVSAAAAIVNGSHPAVADAASASGHTDLQNELLDFNFEFLKVTACISRELELTYQLGRSLRDTANPPLPRGHGNSTTDLDSVKAQLSRPRVAKLQEWLATLAPHLPTDTASIVGVSIGRWSDLSATVFDDDAPGSLRRRQNNSKEEVGESLRGGLLAQGDVWLNLLSGTEPTTGLLTPEGYVAAGEAALSRTARIVRRVVLHHWFAFFALALALAAILYVSARYLGGASKVWTQIAAIASALGVSAKGIGTAVARLSTAAEKSIYGLEKLDAMAWAVTTLPQVRVNNRGVRALRRSGIQKSAPLGHA
jgi:hypothetical protein